MLLPARGALSRGYRAVLAQDLEKTAEVVALRAELKATAAREAEAIASAQRAKEAADAQVAHLEKELAAAAAAAATAAVSAAATATAATGNGKPPLAVPGRRRSGTLRGSRLTEGGQSEHYSDDHEPDSEAGEGASMGRAGAQAGAPTAPMALGPARCWMPVTWNRSRRLLPLQRVSHSLSSMLSQQWHASPHFREPRRWTWNPHLCWFQGHRRCLQLRVSSRDSSPRSCLLPQLLLCHNRSISSRLQLARSRSSGRRDARPQTAENRAKWAQQKARQRAKAAAAKAEAAVRPSASSFAAALHVVLLLPPCSGGGVSTRSSLLLL